MSIFLQWENKQTEFFFFFSFSEESLRMTFVLLSFESISFSSDLLEIDYITKKENFIFSNLFE